LLNKQAQCKSTARQLDVLLVEVHC
jgi:hypothetical protein